ncbi:hypothetical protein BYT27DRAFT_6539586 [Phlegmacium glaucopus]|nr:hypothetical protein BYT27DRAFT_6539586 [Phlegmacium glaucopus]
MKFTDVDHFPPEELEYVHVSAWEDTPMLVEGWKRKPRRLQWKVNIREFWLSEEDPRAVPLS